MCVVKKETVSCATNQGGDDYLKKNRTECFDPVSIIYNNTVYLFFWEIEIGKEGAATHLTNVSIKL